MSNWFENHQPQRTQISTLTIEWPSVLTATASFSSILFQLRAVFKASSKLFRSQGCSDDKNCIDFSCIFFTVQFFFRCKFSFHGKPFKSSLTVSSFSWTNNNSLLRIATNEIAAFCIDNKLCQMAFFVFAKVGKGSF